MLKNLKLNHKILLNSAVSIILLIAVTLIANYAFQDMAKSGHEISEMAGELKVAKEFLLLATQTKVVAMDIIIDAGEGKVSDERKRVLSDFYDHEKKLEKKFSVTPSPARLLEALHC